MAINYSQFRESNPYYHLAVKRCKEPVRQYFDMMNNEHCHWRSILSFSSDIADVTDLVALSHLKNLVALEINQHYFNRSGLERKDGIYDGIVRGWMEMAQTEGSFQHLRVLRLHNQKMLSPHVLPMFAKLPQLHIIVLSGCDLFTEAVGRCPRGEKHKFMLDGWIARRLDWIMDDHDASQVLDPLLELDRKMLQPGYRCFGDCKEEGKPKPSSLQSNLPVMEFKIPESDLISKWDMADDSWAKSIVILARPSGKSSLERKRGIGNVEHGSGTKKRVMKDRGAQDLNSVLGQFI